MSVMQQSILSKEKSMPFKILILHVFFIQYELIWSSIHGFFHFKSLDKVVIWCHGISFWRIMDISQLCKMSLFAFILIDAKHI